LRSSDRTSPRIDTADDAAGFREDVSGNRRGALRPVLTRLDGLVSQTRFAHASAGPLSGGRQRPSRPGGADGGVVGTAGGGEPVAGFCFNRRVAPNGYVWWYIDGLSDDGRHAITLIAFIGSVFSPYYALARRRGTADPFNHCALNVALYGGGANRWALTERGRGALRSDVNSLRIGPSGLNWDGRELTVHVDEITVPVPSRLRGEVRLRPTALTGHNLALDDEGQHRWQPLAPCGRIEVAFEQPRFRWSGSGYLDSNSGQVALENSFRRWDWCRAPLAGGTAVFYDIMRRDGSERSLSIHIDQTGKMSALEAPPAVALPGTFWRMGRTARSEGGGAAVRRTLEDTPFYSRSLLTTRLGGRQTTAIHESLRLDRFASLWVQVLLPFRMPRRR
jgi:carotenoid 1,2-hydratase